MDDFERKLRKAKEEKEMSLADYYNRNIPDYYPTMFLDGYSPQQIWTARRRDIFKRLAEKDKENEVKIRTEIKIK